MGIISLRIFVSWWRDYFFMKSDNIAINLLLGFFHLDEAFHQRIGAADRVIDIQKTGFKAIVPQALIISAGLPGHFAAKSVNHEYRFRENEIGNIRVNGAFMAAV